MGKQCYVRGIAKIERTTCVSYSSKEYDEHVGTKRIFRVIVSGAEGLYKEITAHSSIKTVISFISGFAFDRPWSVGGTSMKIFGARVSRARFGICNMKERKIILASLDLCL